MRTEGAPVEIDVMAEYLQHSFEKDMQSLIDSTQQGASSSNQHESVSNAAEQSDTQVEFPGIE